MFGGIFLPARKNINGVNYGVVNKAGYYIPTQLYEALFLFALFAVLSVLYFKRSNILMQIYLIAYGVWRIIIEFFRDDHVGVLVKGSILTPSQWQSIVFILVGIALLVIYKLLKIPFVLSKDEKEKTKEKKEKQ